MCQSEPRVKKTLTIEDWRERDRKCVCVCVRERERERRREQ